MTTARQGRDCRHTGEAAAVAHAVADVATTEPEVVAITCYTETGRTARLLSAERPSSPIYAFIPDERVRRVNTLNWGVAPLAAEHPDDTDEMIALMDEGLRRRSLVAPGRARRDGGIVARRAHDHEHAEAAPGRLARSLIPTGSPPRSVPSPGVVGELLVEGLDAPSLWSHVR